MADQDKRELLRSMLNGLINDKLEEAQLDFRSYITAKMRELAGLSGEPVSEEQLTEEQVNEIIESASDEEFIEALKNVYDLTEEQVDEVVRGMPDYPGLTRSQAMHAVKRAAGITTGTLPTQGDRNELARNIKQNRAWNRADLHHGQAGRRGAASANIPREVERNRWVSKNYVSDPETGQLHSPSYKTGAKKYGPLTKAFARKPGEGKGLGYKSVPAGPRQSQGTKRTIVPYKDSDAAKYD